MSVRGAAMNARLRGFGTSIFSEMTALANKHNAVNLGQGFPNFNPRGAVGKRLLDAAARAITERGLNQYARSFGDPNLANALARRFQKSQGLRYDPMKEVTVFTGATEGLFCSFNALLELGDEVVVFEPHYDSYRPAIIAAGGRERIVTLRPSADGSRFTFDPEELKQAFNSRTRMVLVNSPHNPTGTVFTEEELMQIADLAKSHDCIVVSDEVYDSIVFGNREHISIATLPDMHDRTITLSSAGKTFSVTGWKVGWALASEPLSDALRTSHQFVTFCSGTPFQAAVAEVLNDPDAEAFYVDLKQDYQSKRDRLVSGLQKAGFGKVFVPEGTYFVQADVSDMLKHYKLKSDTEFCYWLTKTVGVCAIPSSAFYSQDVARNYVRFAFCKTDDIIEQGVHLLQTKLR